ncbi:MAG TPA: hypothetical protein VNC41_01315, partial [Acidimicrobiia bacterium]|nr:hypothetical protein [Acidimicrobiia bacterium]
MPDSADLDERLARLAARRVHPEVVGPIGRRRRKHAAAAGRVFAAGLSASAFLSIVVTMGATAPNAAAACLRRRRPMGPTTSGCTRRAARR